MTGTTKKYLKIFAGGLIVLGKVFARPFFWPWDNQQGISANVTSIVLLVIAIWLLFSAGRQRADDK